MVPKFKCGLEIHQQLNTKEKLFCSCKNIVENKHPYMRIERFLRPVTSELGEKDPTAIFESLKEKKFVYNLYKENTCLVETDEEPPHSLNEEALETALEIALLLNCEIPEELQVMRKNVLDGSNTSGFQRTAIIGMNGYITTSKGKIKVNDVEIEEDSASPNQRREKMSVYDLYRLGIPLVEIGTSADITNVKQAKEVALKIGMLLRSTGKVKRGLGTIRQDVNISIEGGARVEIKGFQDVRNIDKLIEREVERQKNLIEIKKELNQRGIKELTLKINDFTELFKNSKNRLIKNILQSNGKVYSLKIPKFSGLMKKTLSGEKTLAKELVDYVKLYGIKGIIHSDEDLSRYDLTDDFNVLSKKLGKKEKDVVLILAGPAEKAKKAISSLKERIELLPKKIPKETRAVNLDYTTAYLRPLPGKSRMYPETDIPPKEIPKKLLSKIKKNLPETLEEKQKKYDKLIGKELSSQIIDSKYLPLFESCIKEFKVDKKIIANIFTNIVNGVEKLGFNVSSVQDEQFREILSLLEKKKIVKDSVQIILQELCRKPNSTIKEIIKKQKLFRISDKELSKIVSEAVEKNRELIEKKDYHAQKIIMREIMKKTKGRVEGSKITDLIRKEMKKIISH